MIQDPTKPMIAVFEKYRNRFEPYSLFERFMEFMIAGFDITFTTLDRPFSKEEQVTCMELLNVWVTTMNEVLKTKEWYDILGEVYMNYLSCTMKKQWTGQFFTPIHICDLMAQIADPGENGRESIMDCCCGSGRMLLASHIIHPGNYCYAQDLNRICCLMTVCNFLIHGVRGEVVCGNSLDPTDYRDGWKVNETLNILGVPGVRKMDKMECAIYRSGIEMVKEKLIEATPVSAETKVQPKAKTKKQNEPIQYTLF